MSATQANTNIYSETSTLFNLTQIAYSREYFFA